ncbi:30S ribosomal protein S13 [Listeria monocytogenes]|nr:30S ribosomal protein S13 [Listeria monocytogenes]
MCNTRFDILFHTAFTSICFTSHSLTTSFTIISFCLLLFWTGLYEYGHYFLYFVRELEVHDGDACHGKNRFRLDV